MAGEKGLSVLLAGVEAFPDPDFRCNSALWRIQALFRWLKLAAIRRGVSAVELSRRSSESRLKSCPIYVFHALTAYTFSLIGIFKNVMALAGGSGELLVMVFRALAAASGTVELPGGNTLSPPGDPGPDSGSGLVQPPSSA
jgi:hypothetical protein